MLSGITEKDVLKKIGKGGSLYKKYEGRKRLAALVYADPHKTRTINLIKQFFAQIHYTSGEGLDFFWIGYRSSLEIDDIDSTVLHTVNEISLNEKNIPMHVDLKAFHEHNNFYLNQNKWDEKLNNSSFYMVFYEVDNGKPNRNNAIVLNFILGDIKADEEFMNVFVQKLRQSAGCLSLNSIKDMNKVLEKKKISNRIFTIVKATGDIILKLENFISPFYR